MQCNTQVLASGLTLHRWYKVNVDSECRSLAYWNETDAGLRTSKFAKWYQVGNYNKFFSKVTVHVYGDQVPVPYAANGAQAYCYDRGQGRSEIHIRNFSNTYQLEGALSHELGHAQHNYAECFGSSPFGLEFYAIWCRLVSKNGTVFNPEQAPWKKQDGGVENGYEQFANFARCYSGTPATRGVSGNNTDPVLEGFHDPKQKPQLEDLFIRLPEATAMIATYGFKPGSLAYNADSNFLWWQTAAGVYVGQTAPNEWWQWGWSWTTWRWDWVRFPAGEPRYNRA